MLSIRQYKTIKNYIKTNGGATLSSDGSILLKTSGYYVSHSGYELKQKRLSYFTLNKYLRLAKENYCFTGLWLDSGFIYYDISEYTESDYLAFRLAIENKQRAYFDIFNNKSIYIDKAVKE